MNKTLKKLLDKFKIKLSKLNKTHKSYCKQKCKYVRKDLRKSKRMRGG